MKIVLGGKCTFFSAMKDWVTFLGGKCKIWCKISKFRVED